MRPSRKVKEFWDEDNNPIVTEYCLTNCSKRIEEKDIKVFGLRVETKRKYDTEKEVFFIEDISSVKEFVENLFDLLVEGNVTVTSAPDIIEDYIN